MNDVGRWRRVQSRAWIEPPAQQLSDSERVVWLYCVTGPQSTSVGVFHLSPAVAVEQLGNVSQRAFVQRLERVAAAFGWKWDPLAKVLWIPDWLEDNKPQSLNVCKSWRRLLGDVPDCELKREAIVAIKVFLQGFDEAFTKAFGEPSCTLPPTSPKTSRIQGVRSRENGSRSGEHARAALRADARPSLKTNDVKADEGLVSIAKTVLKLTNPNDSMDSLCDAFRSYHRDDGVTKSQIIEALEIARSERRAS